MRFDLIDLRLFVNIVQSGSITRGAEASHMALASASERVSGMESLLGTPLLRRERRGVAPTAAGRALLHHARSVTLQIERMRGDLRAFSAGVRGEVRMLSNTAGLVDLVPAALRRFLTAHPNVDVDLEERTSMEIVQAVAEGQAEFGVIAGTADPGALDIRTLIVDRLAVLAARAHPLAARQAVGFAELLDERFVGLGAGALHDHLQQHAAQLGRRIAYRVRLSSFEAVARLVEAGVGLAILPMSAIDRHPADGVTAIALTDAWSQRQLLVCATDFGELTTHARLLVEELQRQAGKLDDHLGPSPVTAGPQSP